MYWYMRESINFNITFSSAETNDGKKMDVTSSCNYMNTIRRTTSSLIQFIFTHLVSIINPFHFHVKVSSCMEQVIVIIIAIFTHYVDHSACLTIH